MRKTALFATIVSATLLAGSAAFAGDLHITLPDPGRLLTKVLYHHAEPDRHYERAPRYRPANFRYWRHWRHDRRHRHWSHGPDRRYHDGWGDRPRGGGPTPRHYRRNH